MVVTNLVKVKQNGFFKKSMKYELQACQQSRFGPDSPDFYPLSLLAIRADFFLLIFQQLSVPTPIFPPLAGGQALVSNTARCVRTKWKAPKVS